MAVADNFTLNKKRVYEICDEIERRGLKNLFIRCSNGVRADLVDRQLLARMKEIGVREVGFGVDGGNNKILGFLKKGETIETIEQAIKDACELGFDVKIFIIVGTPHETKHDIEDSIRLAKKYPVARVNFNNAIPYPGTEMFDYIKEHNLFLIPPEEYLNNVAEEKGVPVFETPELPKEERIKMLKQCHEVEKEVMKNTAYRMYKAGQTHLDMLIFQQVKQTPKIKISLITRNFVCRSYKLAKVASNYLKVAKFGLIQVRLPWYGTEDFLGSEWTRGRSLSILPKVHQP